MKISKDLVQKALQEILQEETPTGKVLKEWGSSDQYAMNQSIHKDLGNPEEFPGLSKVMSAAEDAVDYYWEDWEEYETDHSGLVMHAAKRYANSMFPDFMANAAKFMAPVDEETTFVTDKAGKTHTTDLDQKASRALALDSDIKDIETAKGKKIKEDLDTTNGIVTVKGKKIKEDHQHNPNDDSDMAKIELLKVAEYSQELLQMIDDGQELDAWIQSKITKISDYIGTVKHYLEGEEYLDHHYGKDHPAKGDEDFYNAIPDEHQEMYEAWVKENTTVLTEALGVSRGELQRIADLYGPQRFTQTILSIRDENVLDDILDALRPLLEEGKEKSQFSLVTMEDSIEADSKEEFIEKMKQAGYDHTGDLSAETDPYKDHPTVDKSWNYGLPRFKQVHGPMNNGGQFRYETLDAYDLYSLEEGLSDDERAKIYFLQQFKQGNIDKLPQDPKVAYLQKLTQDQIDHDKETYRKEIEEGMGGQLDEPYFIEVSVRDARKALDIYKDQFREEDVEMYGSNVYASADPEVIYDLMMSFQAHDIEVHDYEADEEMMENFFSSQNKDKEEEEPKDFIDRYTQQMSYWNEDNHPGKGKRRDTPEEREGSRQAGMQMTQQTHRDKSKYTRKEKHKQNFNEADLNDPVAMKMRAAKDKLAKMRAANAGDDGNDKFFDNAKKIALLKKERERLMRDMEQEAEPAGGPVADEYGDKLNRIDAAIAKLSGRLNEGEKATPSQEEVDQFFQDNITLGTHYLNRKPVMGQKGSFNKTEIAPWDEVDYSNWKTLQAKTLDESLASIERDLDKVLIDIKTHLEMYKDAEGDTAKKAAVQMLKKLNDKKKDLLKQKVSAVAGTGRDQELDKDE